MGEENQQHEATSRTGQEVKPLKVAVNERGNRIGFSHHNARIPDEVVNRIRDLHERDGIGYRRLAAMFRLNLSTVKKLARYERRGQIPARWQAPQPPRSRSSASRTD